MQSFVNIFAPRVSYMIRKSVPSCVVVTKVLDYTKNGQIKSNG